MKNLKKIMASFLVSISVFVLIPVSAHAAWQKNNNGNWTYAENGSLKTGWLLDNDQWYYFNKSGNMLTGWINDNGIWYYMRKNGSLNNSKTTNIIPNEIQSVYNIVKPFAGGLEIKYAGMGLVKDKDVFNNYGIKNQNVLIFKANDEYGINADFYYVYDSYNCKVYKLYDNLTVQYLGQGNETNSITKEQSIEKVKEYVNENNVNVSGMEIWTSEDSNSYIVNYSALGNNNQMSIVEKFAVDKTTGLVLDMFEVYK